MAGSGADQTNQLGGYAVRYVLVRDGAPREMGRVLDATPGLTRLSQEDGSALWRVDGEVSRVSVVASAAQDGTRAGEAAAPVAVPAGPVEAHTEVPGGTRRPGAADRRRGRRGLAGHPRRHAARAR